MHTAGCNLDAPKYYSLYKYAKHPQKKHLEFNSGIQWQMEEMDTRSPHLGGLEAELLRQGECGGCS